MILNYVELREHITDYKKYLYISHSNNCPEGVVNNVFCKSSSDFNKLISNWERQATSLLYRIMGYRYSLTLLGYDGIDVLPEQIYNKKIPVLLTCPYTGVTYIQ